LNPGGGDHTAFIDNIRINGSPKPGFGIQWLLTDQLGTPRMVFDESGALANVKRHDYLPFGEELLAPQGLRTATSGYPASDNIRQQFTSKERDVETNLDFFEARYYSAIHGRFTSPDPTLLSVNGFNPQSWNRYDYVLNNPLVYVDPLGLWEIYAKDLYKDKKNKDGTVTKVYDRTVVYARKTKDDDDGASLAKQLGLEGNDATKFAEKIGSGDNVRLAEQDGDVGRVFRAVESGLTEQSKWEARYPGQSGGPRHSDCSRVACSIAFPRTTFGMLQVGTGAADALISAEGATKSVAESVLRIGDIVRWADARNNPQHFASFIFRDDSGKPIVFSKSGERGPYERATTSDPRWARYGYGTIRGVNSGETGFYRPRN
jgi:RHS repeat-associated protein